MRDSSSWLGPVCLIFCVFVYSVFCFWLSLVVITGRIDSFVELNVVSQKKKTPNLTRCSFDKHRLIFSLRYVWLMARHWCLSSVTLVHSTQTVKFSAIFFSPCGSPIILGLPVPASNIFTNFGRGHPQGCLTYGFKKPRFFRFF